MVSFLKIIPGNNSTAKRALTCGINKTRRFNGTEAGYGRPSGQMQFETRQASEDEGFCLFILKKFKEL